MGAVAPCEPCNWGLRLSSLWSNETREGCADMSAAAPCKPCQRGLRRSSLRGHGWREGRA
eukprot:7265792-Pyramimonas_sp.AAC.1